jgi:hypothetical protein
MLSQLHFSVEWARYGSVLGYNNVGWLGDNTTMNSSVLVNVKFF